MHQFFQNIEGLAVQQALHRFYPETVEGRFDDCLLFFLRTLALGDIGPVKPVVT